MTPEFVPPVFERLMGCTESDLLRALPAALPEAGQVRVRYADWRGTPALPFRVELENGWFGYRLTIETLEVLAPDAAATGP